MISIIICSCHFDIQQSLKENIDNTIGAEYELIVINNTLNKYSICSAYNIGIKKARFPYLCFMHEDILFHTDNWGNYVISHFKESKAGIIGVVGSHFMPDTPSGWYHPQVTSGGCIQRLYDGNTILSEKRINLTRFNGKNSIEAVALDGMWFCMPKAIFDIISFDENTFTGFHCYDLDICFQVRKAGFQVHIVSNILIEHFSYGHYNYQWVENSLVLYNKWKETLPQVAGVEMSEYEMKIRKDLVSEIFLYMSAYAKSSLELDNIRKSYSYRIGKFIIKPLSVIKRFGL